MMVGMVCCRFDGGAWYVCEERTIDSPSLMTRLKMRLIPVDIDLEMVQAMRTVILGGTL